MNSKKSINSMVLLLNNILNCMGINIIVVSSKNDFLKQIFEKKMKYAGFVIVKSRYWFRVFYINTNKILFSSKK